MATSKRVVSVSVKRSKRDRARKIRTVLNESTVASVASGEAMLEREKRIDSSERNRAILTYRGGMGADGRAEARARCARLWTERTDPLTVNNAVAVTDGIGVIRLDPALLDMLRGYVETIRKVYPDVWDVETWDRPWDSAWVGTHEGCGRQLTAEVCHAIGGIAGAAAMMDLTPCMLIDNLRL